MTPEVWSAKMNDFMRAKLVANSFFTDLSADVAGGGDVIHIPSLTEMTATEKANATAVTLNSPTETKVDLTVDQWYEVSFIIEDEEKAQVKHSYNLQERYAKNAAYTVANTLEGALITLFSGFASTVGDSLTNANDSNIRACIAYLDGNDIPQEDRAWFFDPTVFWSDIMGIDKFTLLNESGNHAVLNGAIGTLYGIPVYKTSNIPTTLGSKYNALAQKDAIVFATASLGAGSGIRLQTSYLQTYLGTLVTADILYGVKENRDLAGVLYKTAT
jgi:hypothetical protein